MIDFKGSSYNDNNNANNSAKTGLHLCMNIWKLNVPKVPRRVAKTLRRAVAVFDLIGPSGFVKSTTVVPPTSCKQ